ncbi:MAG: VWA domain-containing protein [Candidatus Omnitrophica bacterium]|nr:VWA domain-containing protein [Candidatus Omnitrophota bacterium]
MRPSPTRPSRRFFTAALFLLWAGSLFPVPLAAQEEPAKQAVINFTGPDGRVYNLVRLTRNFVLYYDRDTIPNAYAILVGDTLEEAWDFFHGQGWRHPAWADNSRVAVYLRTSMGPGEEWAAGFYRLSVKNVNPYFDIRWYDLAQPGNIDFVRSMCTHEFFHFLQHFYDPRYSSDLRWMWEATAAWSEDERLPAAPEIGSFLRHMPAWYPLWSDGTSLKRYDPSDAAVRLMPYGGAIYFKYLSEHHPNGAGVIREIWDEVPGNAGKLSMQILRGVLETADFDRYFTNFSVAVALKSRAPWSFRRGGEIAQEVAPRERTRDWYFKEWSANSIRSASFNLEPYSAAYVEFVPPGGQATSTRLHLVLRRKTPRDSLSARVISFTGAAMRDVVGVDEIRFAAGELAAEHTVEQYGFYTDRTNRVLLVAANPDTDVTELAVAAAVSEPPFLREIQIDRLDGGGTLYHARWDDGAGARNLSVLDSNTIELGKDETGFGPLQVRLVFSREIDGAAQLQVGGAAARLNEPTDERRQVIGRVDRVAVDDSMAGEVFTLPVSVTAVSPDRLGLDSNPQTVPKLNKESLSWDGYEPPGGGADQSHRIQVKKEKKEEEPEPPAPPKPLPAPPPAGRETASSSTFILIDSSGSMGEEGKLEKAKAAAAAAVKALAGSRDAEVAVGYFTDCGSITVPAVGFTKDKSAALSAISGLSAAQGTPLVEALGEASRYLAAHAGSRNRSLICLSDGAETCGGGTASLADYPGLTYISSSEAGKVPPPSFDPVSFAGPGGPAPAGGERFLADPGLWRGYRVEGRDLVENRYMEKPLGGGDAEVVLIERRWQAVPNPAGKEYGWILDAKPVAEKRLSASSRDDPAAALALKRRADPWRRSLRKRRGDALTDLGNLMTESR